MSGADILRGGNKYTVDWSKTIGTFRHPMDFQPKSYPVIVLYKDGTFKLGRIVSPNIEKWAEQHPEVHLVEVQRVGTRYATRGEQTDLF